MKTILTSFDFMQNFDFILTYKNLPEQTPEDLKRTLVHV